MERAALIVLDTHTWVWWVSDPKRLGKGAARAIGSARQIGVAAISCWEVAILVTQRKISLDRDPLAWMEEALALPRVELMPITPAIAARSVQIGALPGDPADRLIVATAELASATLISKDGNLQDNPFVPCVW